MSLLMPEFGLVFWMLLAFGIVFFVLAKFGWPMITGMVERRTNFINDSVQAAQEANKQLENIKIETEAILASAREEQMKILAEASQVREQILEKAKSEATLQAEKIVQEAKVRIELEQKRALEQLRAQVANLSVDIAEKVLRSSLSKDANHSAMVDKILNEITLN